MSFVDGVRDVARGQLGLCRSLLDGVDRAAPTAVAVVVESDPVTRQWPPPLREQVERRVVREIRDGVRRIRELVDALDEGLDYLGDPDLLRETADRLVGPGGARDTVTLLTEQIDPQSLPSTASWEGEGHRTYGDVVARQNSSVDDLGEPLQKLATALTGMASTIETYYVGIAAAVVQLLRAVISFSIAIVGAATAATVVGIIVAIAGVVEGLLDVSGAVIAVGAASVYASQENESAARSVTTALPKQWPAPMFR